ncbi:MAG: methylated-DNA--[protein]-cysteine S-methyltransferase [Azoarcus sp.]|jgi:methylated-DNA-[protein]-cysteine S-methyltransferase|nr:methylated-DNA--[protein]-cysteine S-methyltransferase [Azoarcus sp.]
MYCSTTYPSPIGTCTLACDGKNIVGLWLAEQKYFGAGMPEEMTERNDIPIFNAAKKWLDRYFSGKMPAISELPLAPIGSAFRQSVWNILREIPYGKFMTYGGIAKKIAAAAGRENMSSQAVGGAVGHNPISIIIPCHRVIGSNGNLTGYAGGIKAKIKLLELENADLSGLFAPKKGTAL